MACVHIVLGLDRISKLKGLTSQIVPREKVVMKYLTELRLEGRLQKFRVNSGPTTAMSPFIYCC